MKRLSVRQAGFTIIESMLFLIITGALVASALVMFSGRIARTQFSQAVQELDNTIQATMNEVATGTYVYPTAAPFRCTVGAAGVPTFTPSGTTGQGSNDDCIFVGKVMQIGVASEGCNSSDRNNCTKLNIYTLVGRRVTATGGEVTTLAGTGIDPKSANARLVDNGDGSGVDLTEYEEMNNGLSVYNVMNLTAGTDQTTGAIGITQSLGSYGNTGGVTRLKSGSQILQTWPLTTPYPKTQIELREAIANDPLLFANGNQDPADGIIICLKGGYNQKASIIVGVNDGRVSTRSVIGENPACVDV